MVHKNPSDANAGAPPAAGGDENLHGLYVTDFLTPLDKKAVKDGRQSTTPNASVDAVTGTGFALTGGTNNPDGIIRNAHRAYRSPLGSAELNYSNLVKGQRGSLKDTAAQVARTTPLAQKELVIPSPFPGEQPQSFLEIIPLPVDLIPASGDSTPKDGDKKEKVGKTESPGPEANKDKPKGQGEVKPGTDPAKTETVIAPPAGKTETRSTSATETVVIPSSKTGDETAPPPRQSESTTTTSERVVPPASTALETAPLPRQSIETKSETTSSRSTEAKPENPATTTVEDEKETAPKPREVQADDKPKEVEVAPQPVKVEPPKPVSIDGPDGKGTFTRTESGAWEYKDKEGSVWVKYKDLQSAKIENVESQPDGSVKVSLEGGKIVREGADGARIFYPNDEAFKANHPEEIKGTYKNLVWEGDNLKSFYSERSKKTFHQVAKDQWSENPQSTVGWKGHIEIDGVRGIFIRNSFEGADKGNKDYFKGNGIDETYKPDGSVSITVPFNDKKRVFTFKEGFERDNKQILTQPTEVKVVEPNGTSFSWRRVGEPNKYEGGSSGNTKWDVAFQLKADGEFSFTDLDNGERTMLNRTGHKEVENPKEKTLEVTENGKLTRIKLGDQDVSIDYNVDGKPIEYRFANDNRRMSRQLDGSWSDTPLDVGRPHKPLVGMESLIATHDSLDVRQKLRLMDNVRTFDNLPQFTASEKADIHTQGERLLKGRSDSALTKEEKANLADQLYWHIVNDFNNKQGQTKNCNVTTLRGVSLATEPIVLARTIADVANDGQVVTMDGTTIKPPLASLKVRPGSPEETFPPKSGRTFLGKVWDVTSMNVVWNRSKVDPLGTALPAGSMMIYEEGAPSSRGDTGQRLVRRDAVSNSGITDWVLNSSENGAAYSPVDSPWMVPNRILDAWQQLGGKSLKDRFLIHDNRGVGDKDFFDKAGGTKISSVEQLEKILASGNTARIIQGNSGLLDQKFKQQQALNEGKDPSTVQRPAGGEHVWLIRSYDPQSRTVSIDNSWDEEYDIPNKAELVAKGKDPQKTITVSVDDVYLAMQTTTSGKSTQYSWHGRR